MCNSVFTPLSGRRMGTHQRRTRGASVVALDPAIEPEIQRHRGPQSIRVISFAFAMPIEEIGQMVAAQQTLPGQTGLEEDRFGPLAQRALEELHDRRPETLFRPVDDLVRENTLYGLLEKIFHYAIPGLELGWDVVDEMRV